MNPTKIISLIKIANQVVGKEKYAVSVDDFGCHIYEYVSGFKKLMTVAVEENEAIEYIKWLINKEEKENDSYK